MIWRNSIVDGNLQIQQETLIDDIEGLSKLHAF